MKNVLDAIWSLGRGKEDPISKAHAVVASADEGGNIDQAKLRDYARADARASAREAAELLGMRGRELAETFESLAVELAEETGRELPDGLDERRKELIRARRISIDRIIASTGAHPDDVRSLQVHHIVPALMRALNDGWKELGFSSHQEASKRMMGLRDTVLAMSSERMKAILETNHLLTNDAGERNYTATFIERGDLHRLHDPQSPRHDAVVEGRRERVATVLVALAHLLWKIVEVNKVALRYGSALKERDPAAQDAALSAVHPDIDDNFRSLRGMFVEMFKRGSRNVAIGADTLAVGFIVALIEGAKDIEKAQEMVAEPE